MPAGDDWAPARRSTDARSLPAPVARFLRTEAAGGIVLVVAAAVALVWANSPWDAGYQSFWHTRIVVELGPFTFHEDLRHVVNDGLMALFFFVVGLEVKREAVVGELADLRAAALPVLAAVGGMVVPVAVFLLVAWGGPEAGGWGVPMATDIAFALGVLALFGDRVPSSLKLILLTLAIVDDVGAIVVIAVVYSGGLELDALAVAALGVVAWVGLRRFHVDWPPLFLVIGVLTWYATYRSGVHPTIAGVALGLATSARRLAPADTVKRWAQDLSDEPTAGELRQMTIIARESVSPAEHLEDLLHPAVSFLVLPAFALANAGIDLRSDALSGAGATAVAAGVVLGLVVGKPLGIVAGAWLGIRLGLARMPDDLRRGHLVALGALGGIGFTVSLFIAGLAFPDPALEEAAKLAILVASVLSAALGAVLLLRAARRP